MRKALFVGLAGAAVVTAIVGNSLASRRVEPSEQPAQPLLQKPGVQEEGPQSKAQWHDRLGLSAEQKERASVLREETHAQKERLAPLLREKAQALKELRVAESPDASKVAAAKAELEEVHGELRKLHEYRREAFRALLTEEQKEKLKSFGHCDGERKKNRHGGCPHSGCDKPKSDSNSGLSHRGGHSRSLFL